MAGANFEKWKQEVAWTLSQAAFLLAGKEPPQRLQSEEDVKAGGPEVEKLYRDLKYAANATRDKLRLAPPMIVKGDPPSTSLPVPTSVHLPAWGVPPWIGREIAEPSVWVTWAVGRGIVLPESFKALSNAAEPIAERNAEIYKYQQSLKRQGVRDPNVQTALKFAVSMDTVRGIVKMGNKVARDAEKKKAGAQGRELKPLNPRRGR